MAIDLKTVIVQLSNGKQVKLFDNTGDYDVDNNPTGWGSPNPLRTSIDKLTIVVKRNDVSVYSVEVTDINELDSYLNGTGYYINASDLGSYTYFEDGKYAFEITVEDIGNFTYYDWKYEYLLWKMYADIRKLVSTISVPVKNYVEPYNTSLLLTLFDDILFSCMDGNISNADKIYTFLRNVLDNETVLTEIFKNFNNYD